MSNTVKLLARNPDGELVTWYDLPNSHVVTSTHLIIEYDNGEVYVNSNKTQLPLNLIMDFMSKSGLEIRLLEGVLNLDDVDDLDLYIPKVC